jgi:protein CpxP
MKSKLLLAVFVLLILLNGVLIFMLIKKPHQNKRAQQGKNFLTHQLQFTNNQKNKFFSFDKVHRENMMHFDEQLRKHKDVLFNSFSDGPLNIDSLSVLIGTLEGEKEIEVFRFFTAVRKICNKGQKEKFDSIINRAIKGGKNGPPRGGENHSPRNGTMLPPPPR